MGFNSVFKELKFVKNPGNERLNNLNDPVLNVLTWLRFFLPWLRFFRCFFLSCKANARVKLAKTRHGQHSSTLVVICVVLCIVCVYMCTELYYCHRVATQLQLNISCQITYPFDYILYPRKVKAMFAWGAPLPVVRSGVSVGHTRNYNSIVHLCSQRQHPFVKNWRHWTSDICERKD